MADITTTATTSDRVRSIVQWTVAILLVAAGVAVATVPLVGALLLSETYPLLGFLTLVVTVGLYAFIAANWSSLTARARQ